MPSIQRKQSASSSARRTSLCLREVASIENSRRRSLRPRSLACADPGYFTLPSVLGVGDLHLDYGILRRFCSPVRPRCVFDSRAETGGWLTLSSGLQHSCSPLFFILPSSAC